MRTRAVGLFVLLALPVALGAQGIRLPRIGRRPTPPPAELPPETPAVARALALQRSRWSTEGYGLVTQMQVPASTGGMSTLTTFGVGTHADYRINDHYSTTLDFTASSLNTPVLAGTAEFGQRYAPLPLDAEIRPYIDVRASYMYMYDEYLGSVSFPGGNDPIYMQQSRYSRGFGAVIGTGFEYTLTSSLALTTGFQALRNSMTTYRVSPGSIPAGAHFWNTTYRYTLGFKYNRVRHLANVADRKK